jgi:transposase
MACRPFSSIIFSLLSFPLSDDLGATGPLCLAFPIAHRGKRDLVPLMIDHTKAGSLYYTDDWHAYTFLRIRGNHGVITKGKGKPKDRDHLNGIEDFWPYAKSWLYQYRGVPRKYFHLHLKEIEWWFNHRSENLVPLLRKLMSQQVVKEQPS